MAAEGAGLDPFPFQPFCPLDRTINHLRLTHVVRKLMVSLTLIVIWSVSYCCVILRIRSMSIAKNFGHIVLDLGKAQFGKILIPKTDHRLFTKEGTCQGPTCLEGCSIGINRVIDACMDSAKVWQFPCLRKEFY